MKQITPAELAAWLADSGRGKPVLLDVREPWEYEKARIEGAHLVPMREVPARVGELDPQSKWSRSAITAGAASRSRCSWRRAASRKYIT